MDSSNNETTHEFPLFKVYNDGRIKRYSDRFANGGQDLVPTGLDSKTGVQTKAVIVSPKLGVSTRLFIPKINGPNQKFPLVIHYHGGAICIGSPFMKVFHNFLVSLEHSHKRMLLYPILPSQKVTLSIIQYYFTIYPASQLLFSYSTH